MIKYISDRPMFAAFLAVICMADSLHCIWAGHADWWYPALLTVMCTHLIYPKRG